MPFILVIVGAIVFTVLLQATPFGRSLYAIGANPVAAQFSGIDVAKTKLRLFMLSGAMARARGHRLYAALHERARRQRRRLRARR